MGDALIIGALSPGIRKAQRNALDAYFPFVGGPFPFNEQAADVLVDEDVTWDDTCGYKQVGKLTIAPGKTITIGRSPFYIFADEIIFGGVDSIISANGPSGGPEGEFPTCWARGGTVDAGGARAQAGCGGGMLVIVANRISGAAGLVRANGGDGYINEIPYGRRAAGGQGALSQSINLSASGAAENFGGTFSGFLAPGGGGSDGGKGGGSGTNYLGGGGGGSGIGGGCGGSPNQGITYDGRPNTVPIPLPLFLLLASYGCLGGGGGAAYAADNANQKYAGGGGGGGIGVIVKDLVTTPTLQANGGLSATNHETPASGGAGFTAIWEVA
jgi:hypothetical protein